MKVRVLVINPLRQRSAPLAPPTLFEQDGEILLMGDYWVRAVEADNLEQVTVDQIRACLPVTPDATLAILSEPQECPYSDLMTPEALKWRRFLWEATACAFRELQIANAS
jgi:hypothetical protein